MSKKTLSVNEIKAVAEAAITAKHALDAAKTALDASPDDESLQNAHEAANSTYLTAQAAADALSQGTDDDDDEKKRKLAKLKRKKSFIEADIRELGGNVDSDDEDDDDEDDDDLDEIDPDAPLTLRQLGRIEAKKAGDTTTSMVNAIEDPVAREAVRVALKDVRPSGNSDADYRKAIAIANMEKTSKVLQELARKPAPPQHRSGSGSPPKPPNGNDTFEPTTQEVAFMRHPYNLSKEQIIAARPKQ